MQKITQQALTQLTESTDGKAVAVTIYIPLEATASPPHITENQIRFKNLIHKAVEQLKATGDTSDLSKQLCDRLAALQDDIEFWKESRRGMLLCAAPGMLEMYHLPVDTEEYVAVDTSFHLAPVVALMGDAKEYYVLALAQQRPRIYKGDSYDLSEINIGLPETLRVGLGIDEPNQKSENQGSATGSSLNTGWFNGRGGARDPMDNDRLKFLHLIDSLLHDKLDQSVPLVLAGIDSEVDEFRDVSKYPKLLQGSIAGNHTETNMHDLFALAQPIIMHELVEPEHAAIKEEYERLQGANPERVASDAISIAEAAEQGRVDKLIASMGRQTTDTVQDNINSVFRITFIGGDGEANKLLNNLAMKVWQMSGRVVSLLPEEMPNGAPILARLRY